MNFRVERAGHIFYECCNCFYVTDLMLQRQVQNLQKNIQGTSFDTEYAIQ